MRHTKIMDGDKQLRRITSQPTKPGKTARLDEALSKLMENQILPQRARFVSIIELWNRLLPADLRRHCGIVDVAAGQLTVQVDSPSYANELRWCRPGLLEEIQMRCPRARIKEIKIILG